jgi:hypothetical protein
MVKVRVQRAEVSCAAYLSVNQTAWALVRDLDKRKNWPASNFLLETAAQQSRF